MTDVVEIAKACRARLAAELAKLDNFIRMAEALVQNGRGLGRGPVMAADADHFEFDQEASAGEDELVLSDLLSNDAAPVGADAGCRRLWSHPEMLAEGLALRGCDYPCNYREACQALHPSQNHCKPKPCTEHPNNC